MNFPTKVISRSSSCNFGTEFQCVTLMTFASAARQIVVAGVTAVFFQVGPLQAQDVDWNNTTNSNSWYEIDGNWVGRLAPPAAQRGRFNRASGYEVWWDSNTASATPEVGFLSVLQGDVTFWATGSQWKYRINGSGGEGSHSDFSM